MGEDKDKAPCDWWQMPPRNFLDRSNCLECGGPFEAHVKSVALRDQLKSGAESIRLRESLAPRRLWVSSVVGGVTRDTTIHEHKHYDDDIAYVPESALATARKEADWQPIETAPKDGRTLLLGYENTLGKWRTVRGQWFTDEEIGEWENGDDFEADWYETSVENDEPPNCWLIHPTHWMPLPKSPALERVDRKDGNDG